MADNNIGNTYPSVAPLLLMPSMGIMSYKRTIHPSDDILGNSSQGPVT